MLTSVLLLIGIADHDVHDLAAAGRWSRSRPCRCRSSACEQIAKRARPKLHLAVDEHRRPQRADRGDVHRSRHREGVRPPARGRAAVPRHQRRALRGVVRRAVHVEPDAAGHDVHGQHPVRASSRSSAGCGSRAARSPSATSRRSSSTRGSFSMPLTQLASMMNVFQSGIASFERVFEFLDAEEQSPDPVAERRSAAGARPRRVPRRHVLLRPRPAADRVAVAASPSPGQTIAIVGPTGAGKTTLVNLIMRFYELERRRDHARRPRHLVDARAASCDRKIGMVLQDTWLFGGTIHDNIAYGNPDATEEQILEAARATYVDRFVHSLPDGYDTRHQRRGRQHQRRPEAAAHDRPRLPRRPGDPHPRRGHQLGRHPHRGADPGGDERAARLDARAS